MKRTAAFLMLFVAFIVCVASFGCIALSGKNDYSQAKDALIFGTKDVFGSDVSSEKLFEQSKITMINFWASWCGPCAGELAELQTLHEQFKEYGCAVVGILDDGDTEQGLADGKRLMELNGVDYTVLISNSEIRKTIQLQYYPTTVFVNSRGEIIGEPIIGARVDEYLPALKALLNEAEG